MFGAYIGLPVEGEVEPITEPCAPAAKLYLVPISVVVENGSVALPNSQIVAEDEELATVKASKLRVEVAVGLRIAHVVLAFGVMATWFLNTTKPLTL